MNIRERSIPQERLWTSIFYFAQLILHVLILQFPNVIANLGGNNSAMGLVIGIFAISAIGGYPR